MALLNLTLGTYRDVAFMLSLEGELAPFVCETDLSRYHFIFWIATQSAIDCADRRRGHW
jgi:hypothetical protein